jgi:enoyl-CoA hydratase
MTALVSYRLEGSIATISMDDGKANALSLAMLRELDAAFDRAQEDRAVVILTGREGVFSAGFDLRALRGGGSDGIAMLCAGFALGTRLLGFPMPVIAACPGHAIAMGAFLLLSSDYRVGASGPFKLLINEVAIGLTMPHAAVEICRARLAPAHFNRALLLAQPYTPESSVEAGLLDRVVAQGELAGAAQAVAAEALKLDLKAHAASKLRMRAPVLEALKHANLADEADFRALTGG